MIEEPPERMHIQDLVLRKYKTHDHASLLTSFADPDIGLWNPQTTDPEEVVAWATARNDWSAGSHVSWAVADAADHLVGSVSLHRIDRQQEDAEVGYWVAPWARRRGIALRVLAAATQCGFETMGLHRIYLHHAVQNAGSCVVATRAGFVLEGTLRQSHLYGDGARHDEHLHARLRTDPQP